MSRRKVCTPHWDLRRNRESPPPCRKRTVARREYFLEEILVEHVL